MKEGQPVSRGERRRQARLQKGRESKPGFSRRRFIVGGLAGAAVLGAAWKFSWLELISDSISGNSELRQRERKYEREIEETDAVLQGLDPAIDKLGEVISTQDNFSSGRLLEPVSIYQQNKRNPQRNKPRLLLEDLKKRGAIALKSPNFEIIEDINYFFIQATDDPRNLAASYSPTGKTIELNTKLTNPNLLDLLITYHELVHVVQDTNVRRTFTTSDQLEKYFAFFENKVRIIGSFEHEAYLNEIQVLNFLTNGQLREDALSGNLDVYKYSVFMRAREEQKDTVSLILDMTKLSFVPESPYAQSTDAFVAFINDQYSVRGAEIYDITQDRKLIRVK